MLTFKFRKVTLTAHLDNAMSPRRAHDQPLIFPILEDLVELLNTGHIKQFFDSMPGRDAIPIDEILV